MSCNLYFLFWGALLWQLFVWFVKAVIAQHKAQNPQTENVVQVEIVDEREVLIANLKYDNELLRRSLAAKEKAFLQVSERWVNHSAISDVCPECSNFFRSFRGQEYRNAFRYIQASDTYRDKLERDYDALVEYVEKVHEKFVDVVGELPFELEDDD